MEKSSSLEQNNLEFILQASPIGMVVFDENREILFSNSAAEQLFNKRVDQAKKLKCGDFITCIHRHGAPDGCGNTVNCIDCKLDRALRATLNTPSAEAGIQGEAVINSDISRNPIYVSYKINPLFLNGQRYAVMALENITDRKEAETALKESEKRYRALFEKSAEGVILHDDRGTIFDANQAAIEMFGYTLNELKSMKPFNLVHPDETANVKRDAETLRKKDFLTNELRCMRKDGTEFIASIRIKRVAENLIQAVLIDITSAKKQEQQLRLLTLAIEQSAETVVITDRTGAIQYVNPAFCATTGYTAEEAIGKNPRILKSGKMKEDHYKNLWETLAQGKTWRGEFCNLKKNGEEFWEDASISPVYNDKGLIDYYVAVKGDKTRQKELEQHREDVERIMRHDLKTPLTGIISLPRVIALDDNLTEDQRETLALIEESGKNMLQLIDSSLDMFKMEMGTFHYSSSDTDAATVIENIIRQNHPRLDEKNLISRIYLNDTPLRKGEKFIIPSDPVLLNRMISNLISNAIEASPEGGEIVIIYSNQNYGRRIIIKNSGTVPKPIRNSFFEKYTTRGKSGGTGIGTYSAKLIAETMGYKIKMETSDSENTTSVSLEIDNDTP